MRLVKHFLVVLLLLALKPASSKVPPYSDSYWRISNLNGYPYYSDRPYIKGFLNKRYWQNDPWAVPVAILENGGIVPQPCVTYVSKNRFVSIENRAWGTYEHIRKDFAQNLWPSPATRTDITTNLYMGTITPVLKNWKLYSGIGISYTWHYKTTWRFGPEDDHIWYSTSLNHFVGAATKIELVRSYQNWELGVGIGYNLRSFSKLRAPADVYALKDAYPFMEQKTNVTTLGLVVARKFNKN